MKLLTKVAVLSSVGVALIAGSTFSYVAQANDDAQIQVAANDSEKKRGKKGRMSMKARDLDQNGTISLEEFLQPGEKSRMSRLDANSDGVITSEEIDAVASKRGNRMRERILERMDINGDGQIDKAEVETKKKEQFAKIDADSDGELTRDEMKNFMKEMRKNRKAKRSQSEG